MSSVMPPVSGDRSSESAFFESQKLPSQKRGMTFEALFYRQLHHVTARIHDTENIEQIMLESSQDICKLLNADRLTLYAVSEDGLAIVSKVKTGLNSSRDLKLPISPQSIAGYVAYSKKPLNLPDVYDDEALKQIHPSLSFLKEVDKRSGYRTKQMLVAPILDGKTLHGVLQVINNKSDEPFGELELDGVDELCKTLATAIRQRLGKTDDAPARGRPNTTGWLSTVSSLSPSSASAYRTLARRGDRSSICSWQPSNSSRRRLALPCQSSLVFLMSRSIRVAFVLKCCKAPSSGSSWWSRDGFRWKSPPKVW